MPGAWRPVRESTVTPLWPEISRTLVLVGLLLAATGADAERRRPYRQSQQAMRAEADNQAQLIALLQAQVAELQRRLATLEESASQRTAPISAGAGEKAAAVEPVDFVRVPSAMLRQALH